MDNVRSQTYAVCYYLAWFKIFKSIKGEKRKIQRYIGFYDRIKKQDLFQRCPSKQKYSL